MLIRKRDCQTGVGRTVLSTILIESLVQNLCSENTGCLWWLLWVQVRACWRWWRLSGVHHGVQVRWCRGSGWERPCRWVGRVDSVWRAACSSSSACRPSLRQLATRISATQSVAACRPHRPVSRAAVTECSAGCDGTSATTARSDESRDDETTSCTPPVSSWYSPAPHVRKKKHSNNKKKNV